MSTALGLLGAPPLAALPWSGLPWLIMGAAGAGLLGILLALLDLRSIWKGPEELAALVKAQASEEKIREWLIKKGFRETGGAYEGGRWGCGSMVLLFVSFLGSGYAFIPWSPQSFLGEAVKFVCLAFVDLFFCFALYELLSGGARRDRVIREMQKSTYDPCKAIAERWEVFRPERPEPAVPATARDAATPAAAGELEALVIIFNRDFSPRETFVNSILSKMRTRGRTYRQWMSESTPVSILVDPAVEDPFKSIALATVQFRCVLGGRFSMERMEQADFEGSHGISGIIFSHWSV